MKKLKQCYLALMEDFKFSEGISCLPAHSTFPGTLGKSGITFPLLSASLSPHPSLLLVYSHMKRKLSLTKLQASQRVRRGWCVFPDSVQWGFLYTVLPSRGMFVSGYVFVRTPDSSIETASSVSSFEEYDPQLLFI